MSDPNVYIMLMSSLPSPEALFLAKRPPLSRLKLDRRLRVLAPEHARAPEPDVLRDHLELVADVTRAFASSLDIDETLANAMSRIMERLQAEAPAVRSARARLVRPSHRGAVAHALHTTHNDLLARLDAGDDLDVTEAALAEGDLAALGARTILSLGDREQVRAAALDEHRLLRHRERAPGIEHHGQVHEHAGR